MKSRNRYLIVLTFLVLAFSHPDFIWAADETSTMMCDGGVVNIGDTDVDVRNNCGEPDTQGANQWMVERIQVGD